MILLIPLLGMAACAPGISSAGTDGAGTTVEGKPAAEMSEENTDPTFETVTESDSADTAEETASASETDEDPEEIQPETSLAWI